MGYNPPELRSVTVSRLPPKAEPSKPQTGTIVRRERDADEAVRDAVRADVDLVRKLAAYERGSVYLGLVRGVAGRLGRMTDAT